MKDKDGIDIVEGCYVVLLEVEPHWFQYEPEQEAIKLHEACKNPVLVSDIYDGRVTVELPSTKDHGGEMVSNSITTLPTKVKVVVGSHAKNT